MLFKNDVYNDQKHRRFRLLQIVQETDEAWVYCLDKDKATPENKRYSLLNHQLDREEIVLADSSEACAPLLMSPKAKARRDEAWGLIEPLASESGILNAETRSALITECSQKTGTSKTTLYKYLRQFWNGGQTRDALIPGFCKSGRKEKHQTCRRGRKPKNARYAVYQLTADDFDKIRASIDKDFLKVDVATQAVAHLTMLRRNYTYVDGNNVRQLKPLGERPSLRQYRIIYHNEFPLEETIRKKKGDKEFERNHAARLGSTLLDCLGVGHIYEIDATQADVYLVARASRARIIGKPTLYLIYDRWSRLVVGFYVGLEPASWSAAMEAILSLAEDKCAMCTKYHVPYDSNDWPAHGIFPQKFLGDRGEMLSKDSDRVCDGMQSTVSNTTALAPQRKGTVEPGFKLIPRSMASSVPGYEPPENVTRRRGKHYEHDACLTLDEFITLILRAIVCHNRSVMRGYPLTPELICRNVPPLPLELWKDNVTQRAGYLPRYSEQYLRFRLLPVGEATVTDQGILFSHCFYSSQQAVQYGWFVKAKNKGRFKVSISFYRCLVDEILIHDSAHPAGFFTAQLTAKSLKYKGYSSAEVAETEHRGKELIQSMEQVSLQERADLLDNVDHIAKPAHKEMKSLSKGKSRSSRRADTASDRGAERRERRQEQGALMHRQWGEPGIVEPTGPAAPIPTSGGASTSPDTALPGTSEANASSTFSDTQLAEQADSLQAPRASSVAEKLRQKTKERLNGKII